MPDPPRASRRSRDPTRPLAERHLDKPANWNHDPTVDRDTFLEAAGRRGIDAATAAALHDDLYGVDVAHLSRKGIAFAGENRLARTVEVFVWVGTVARPGSRRSSSSTRR